MKKYYRQSALALLLCWLLPQPSNAQLGGNNPTGPGGAFNGNVTTGGSYDPYTGNARRSVTDIVVAGSIGSYGLSYSRTWNTRKPGWHGSFDWSIDSVDNLPAGQPIPYAVNFPDGKTEIFGPAGQQNGIWRAAAGVRERLKPWDGTFCYLLLPDGGKVQFRVTMTSYYDPSERRSYYSYSFTPQAIIDPYGRTTSLSYNPDGTLNNVTEPAGRRIQFFYTTVSGTQVIDYIKASDNREVHYTYQSLTFGSVPYTLLTKVDYYSYYGDPQLTAIYGYRSPNVGNVDGYPLLNFCDDPMYAGSMKKINYAYRIVPNLDGTPPVYAQLDAENSGNGIPVSRLSVSGTNTRTETRGDGCSRTFTYANGYLTSWTDFRNIPSYQTYDNARFVNSIRDGRGYTTSFTNSPITGVVTRVQYPATPGDTPPNTPPGAIIYTYGWASCPDPNNRDANNPYYIYSVTDEAGNITRFTRDTNKRVVRIDYPDAAYETFTYNAFGQVLSHLMKTGGTETFTYDGRGLKQCYRDPDHATGNPTARYQYDTMDRLSGITDALGSVLGDGNHTISYAHNTRGQLILTTLPTDPADGVRHTVGNAYNPNGDGTLASVTDQLGHITSYTYDDYRRIRSITTPQRFLGDTTSRTINISYNSYQSGEDDYTHTDANVTRLALPSQKIIRTTYDENHRKTSETASAQDGTTDSATTSFEYDDAGNLKVVKYPDPQSGQASAGRATTYYYDERNRPSSMIDALNHSTLFQYDAGGRHYTEQRPNGQTVTYNSYDQMNRLLRQTVTQAPTADAVTNYTWWPSGMPHTMQDPQGNTYNYQYDLMGRKTSIAYPSESGISRSEVYSYDQATGNLRTYTNRAGNIQTFSYDNLNRQIRFDWNDGYTSWQTTRYDAASLVRQVANWDATINFDYYADNLLKTQQEATGSNYNHTNTYSYDADGNRASITYPSTYLFQYNYNGRDQLNSIFLPNYGTVASYLYDRAGNRQQRTLHNQTVTSYAPVDALNRSSWIQHTFAGGQTSRFDYDFDEMSRFRYEWRDSGTADSYTYDKAGQIVGMIWNGTFSNGTVSGNTLPLSYDAAGNRTGTWGSVYSVNSLNEYTDRDGSPVTSDLKGNLRSFNGWTYTYDAQNRLTSAVTGGTTLEFWYDPLNRQIARRINGAITRSVWDGWNLIEERDQNDAPLEYYLHGARNDELLVRFGGAYGTTWFCQDGRGNTSHLVGEGNEVLERYKYGLAGGPQIFDANGNGRAQSAWENRFFFQGRDFLKEGGIYDYRNRFYLFGLGRFLQPDPIGFAGDPTNLYRYCHNDPVNKRDPSGLGGVNDDPLGLEEPSTETALGITTQEKQNQMGFNNIVEIARAIFNALFPPPTPPTYVPPPGSNAVVPPGKPVPTAPPPPAWPTGGGSGGPEHGNSHGSGISPGFSFPSFTISGINYPTPSQFQNYMADHPNAQVISAPSGLAPGEFSYTSPSGNPTSGDEGSTDNGSGSAGGSVGGFGNGGSTHHNGFGTSYWLF